MVNEWVHDEKTIAERFRKDELSGKFKIEFFVKENEKCVLEKYGEIVEEIPPGKVVLSTIFNNNFDNLIMINKGEHILDKTVKNILLSDGGRIDLKFVIKFHVDDVDVFVSNIFSERKTLTLDDVWAELLSSVIFKTILPKINELDIKRLLNEKFRENVKEKIGIEVAKSLKKWGFRGKLLVEIIIPEDSIKMAKEKEMEKSKVVEKKEDMPKKEEKHAEKQEPVKQVKGDEIEKLERELEELKKAKEIAEQKFYKKELSEEAFKRMAENFEQRIIEIETKLKNMKK